MHARFIKSKWVLVMMMMLLHNRPASALHTSTQYAHTRSHFGRAVRCVMHLLYGRFLHFKAADKSECHT